ncbi:MAG TPA: malto-oligosyltrehalose synthase [Gemmatimonadaceae bacterium]|jgi:(1->4)-alpha-D-glucan 1-alpha-D-glucosylmutase
MPELTATYRLQMNAGFTFDAARKRVEYFQRLGISHLYLSPILAARRGSMHGYDVVDPTRVNPELGSEAELRALADDLHARDMGIILDIVPNHMGIGPENSRWDDVLANGERSRYARWFDVDWTDRGAGSKVVLPVLGDDLDKVLERGELSVSIHEGEDPRVQYFKQSFPLDLTTLPPELQLVTFDPEETGELADLFSGIEGRERLRDLLAVQHYRLAHWRDGPTSLNYRRFFDVNDLAGVRVEDPAVFAESHALILRLVRDKVIDGLRIDHIDGLADPRAYLERLRAAVPLGVPIFVEKILAPDEQLRDDWPIDGTTGYEFLNELEDVFIDPVGGAEVDALYRRFRHLDPSSTFQGIARADKLAVLRDSLRPDVRRLAFILTALAKAAGLKTKPSQPEFALVEFIASFPTYRSYVDGRATIDDADRASIQAALADAQTHTTPDLAPLMELIAAVLLGARNDLDSAARVAFVKRFQQLTGPTTAKGVEDTALYVYTPLVSRNEVGGAPDRPLYGAVERFHRANEHRAASWPLTLNATNTHDTKRSADVRARLDALTECASDWERSVRRWRRLNAKHRSTVHGRLAPDTNTEYLLYQTLVALWPAPRPGRRADDLPDRSWRDSVRTRLVAYVLKAAREAKTQTSWVAPSGDYEKALNRFVEGILSPKDDAPFLTDVSRLVSCIAPLGVANSLSRVALHLMSPGTPDIYQGDERWNFTLVDPDNRRQIDYDATSRALEEVETPTWPTDPSRSKLFVVRRLLALRRERGDLFRAGSYLPIRAVGAMAKHVVAFARVHEGQHVLTIATRLSDRLGGRDDRWGDTRLELPDQIRDVQWRSRLAADSSVYHVNVQLSPLLRTIPVAVLAD